MISRTKYAAKVLVGIVTLQYYSETRFTVARARVAYPSGKECRVGETGVDWDMGRIGTPHF